MTVVDQLHQKGIVREGTPKRGFACRHLGAGAVTSAERERIEALKVPPAWEDVAIAKSPRARVQATGKDRAGRWQYLYHPVAVQKREREKYRKMMAFAASLPAMRKTVHEHLRRGELDREKVMATILRVLSTRYIRAGSQKYAGDNASYGIATLLLRHVKVHGDTVVFDFEGKSQQHQHRELKDRSVAKVIRQLMRSPGRELFKFKDAEGGWVDVRRRHVNTYIKEVMCEQFSAKDFRTWAGTLLCACALARTGFAPEDSKTARKRKVVAAIKETAALLGNTPAVCRASYIYPTVLASYERGQVVASTIQSAEELVKHRAFSLHRCERALLKLIR